MGEVMNFYQNKFQNPPLKTCYAEFELMRVNLHRKLSK